MVIIVKVAKAIVFASLLAALLLAANRHGQERVGKTNFWIIFAIIATNAVALIIGGFFNPVF